MMQNYIDRTGKSQHALERQSVDPATGRRIDQSRIGLILSGDNKEWPAVRSIPLLARALETTEAAIVLGYAAEFGFSVEMPEFATRLPFGVDDLPEEVQDSLLRHVRALVTVDQER